MQLVPSLSLVGVAQSVSLLLDEAVVVVRGETRSLRCALACVSGSFEKRGSLSRPERVP
jgi:hypothetical protein